MERKKRINGWVNWCVKKWACQLNHQWRTVWVSLTQLWMLQVWMLKWGQNNWNGSEMAKTIRSKDQRQNDATARKSVTIISLPFPKRSIRFLVMDPVHFENVQPSCPFLTWHIHWGSCKSFRPQVWTRTNTCSNPPESDCACMCVCVPSQFWLSAIFRIFYRNEHSYTGKNAVPDSHLYPMKSGILEYYNHQL